MKYIQWTLAKLSEIKNRLFVLQDKEKEPLSRFSIAVILLLDVFLFINIFVGIEEQSNTVDRPSDFVSYVCQNNARIYSKKDISVVDSLANMFSGNRSPYLQRDSSESLDCQGIQKALDEAGQNPILISLFDEREAIQANLLAINNQISRKEQDISRVRSSYDTKLLEKIAGQERQYQLDAGTAETAKSETLKHQEALS